MKIVGKMRNHQHSTGPHGVCRLQSRLEERPDKKTCILPGRVRKGSTTCERLKNEQEDHQIWRKQLEGVCVKKSCVYRSYGSDDDGSMMRYMGQPKVHRLSESDYIRHFLNSWHKHN